MPTTKIKGLTGSNVRALEQLDLRTPITKLGKTYAVFTGTPLNVLTAIQAVMEEEQRAGRAKHGTPGSPAVYPSLVAVRNKLREANVAAQLRPGLTQVTKHVEVTD